MPMLERKRTIGIKLEAVEGTPETITGAEVIYAENVAFDDEVESLAITHQLATLSKQAPVAGRSKMSISFDVPVYGATAAGSAPFWGVPLQACGFAETLVASTSAKYLPASSALKSATIKVFVDGLSFRMRGCRGTVSAKREAGKLPFLQFKFFGLWDPATDADAVKDETVLTGSAYPAFNPKVFKAALLVADTLRGVTEGWSWNVANTITYVPDANMTNFKRCDLTERDVSGELDMEAITKATYDFHAKLAAKTAIQIRGYIGADDAASSVAGGTGAASSLTDTTKNWITNQWAGYKLLDSALAVFPVTANTATVLTVTGTPASGAYIIYQAGKLVRETCAKAVLKKISDKKSNGIYHFGMPFDAALTAGDDELELFVI